MSLLGTASPRAIEPNRLRVVMPRARSRGASSRRMRSTRSRSARAAAGALRSVAMAERMVPQAADIVDGIGSG